MVILELLRGETLRTCSSTGRYMSPEPARAGEVGPPADVWGAGIVLRQAATGRHVFDARGEGYPQLERRPAPVARLRPRLPRRIAAAIDAALDPDADARPTVGALSDASPRRPSNPRPPEDRPRVTPSR